MTGKLGRRTLIIAGALGIGGVLYGVPVMRGMRQSCLGWTTNGDMQAENSLRRVGYAWLMQSEDPYGVVASAMDVVGALESLNGDRQKLEVLSDLIAVDFENGAVAQCQGWILAQTELNLCTALYLNRDIEPEPRHGFLSSAI